MNIAVTSDIHGDTRRITELEKNRDKIDVVFICGDTTQNGTENELDEMFSRLNKIGKVVVLIAGNHDLGLQKKKVVRKLKKYKNVKYLCDSYVKVNGFTIYGTPYVPPCKRWGFQVYSDEEFKCHLPKKNCDILLTHTPPSSLELSHFQTINGMEDFGFASLREFILNKDVKYCFCGHIHQNGGNVDVLKGTMVMNVSDKIYYMEV